MEMIHNYRIRAHTDGFREEYQRIKVELSSPELSRFLEKSQKGTKPVEARIEPSDILRAISWAEISMDDKSKETNKVVIQKANAKISIDSSISGYWTNLAFIHYENDPYSKEGNWYLYAYARGRFKGVDLNLAKMREDSFYKGIDNGLVQFRSMPENANLRVANSKPFSLLR